MKFSVGDGRNTGQGIAGIFKALAMAPMYRQQAEDEARMQGAKQYSAEQQGRKYGAEADGLAYTLDRRKSVPDRIADPNLPQFVKTALTAFQDTGDTNMDRYSQAMGNFQQQQYISDIASGNEAVNPANVGRAYAATEGKPLYDAVGNTGYSMDKFSSEIPAVLQKLFGDKTHSEIAENQAQAGAASARAKLIGAKATGTGGLTPAQLRTNAEIMEARDYLANLDEAEVDRLSGENPSFMNAGDRQTWNVIQRASKPMYGESSVPQVTPQPTAPKVEAPGFLEKLFGGKAPAKDAVQNPMASTMDAPRNPAQRQAGQVYNTPKGPMQWTGTGWIPQ
jgi:hypothetical protein